MDRKVDSVSTIRQIVAPRRVQRSVDEVGAIPRSGDSKSNSAGADSQRKALQVSA